MTPNLPDIAALYAGLNALLAIALSINVVMNRARRKIDLGDGGNMDLLQVIRAHGNNAEYLPLALLLLALIEMTGAPPFALHIIGILLTLGRLLHAQGLLSKPGASVGRVAGQSATWLALLAAALFALYIGVTGPMTG